MSNKISPTSLKRAEARKFSYNRKIFSEPMRYKKYFHTSSDGVRTPSEPMRYKKYFHTSSDGVRTPSELSLLYR